MSTVMIMGHNPEFKYLIQRYVRRSGHRAVLVDSLKELLAAALQETPVAIILETDTPQEIGRSILTTLKSDRLTCDVPVVVCSWLDLGPALRGAEGPALSEAEGPQGSQRNGVAYLRKPVLYGDLVSALTDTGVSIRAEGPLQDADGDGWRNQGGGGPRR